jgi:hypothetical protein
VELLDNSSQVTVISFQRTGSPSTHELARFVVGIVIKAGMVRDTPNANMAHQRLVCFPCFLGKERFICLGIFHMGKNDLTDYLLQSLWISNYAPACCSVLCSEAFHCLACTFCCLGKSHIFLLVLFVNKLSNPSPLSLPVFGGRDKECIRH